MNVSLNAVDEKTASSIRDNSVKDKGQPKKLYGYMRTPRTVKEKVGQIRKENGELTVYEMWSLHKL